MSNGKFLHRCRVKLGCEARRRGAIAALIAQHLKIRPPVGKQQQWKLIRAFGRPDNRPTASVSVSSRRRLYRDVVTDPFLSSYAWRQLRMVALKQQGARCQCCGASAKDGVRINVDHIKPRRDFPELALVLENLQVLCGACNHGKGNWDQTDWREVAPVTVAQPKGLQ
jgi:5-methylcytosine-specific restriction endonuclease McrA